MVWRRWISLSVMCMVAGALLLPIYPAGVGQVAAQGPGATLYPGGEFTYRTVLQSYRNGTYSGISPGDTIYIHDSVRSVHYSEGEDRTYLWTGSTKGTVNHSTPLLLLGDYPVSTGDHFNLTAVVVGDGRTEHLTYTPSDMHIRQPPEKEELTWLEEQVYGLVPEHMENRWVVFGVVLLTGLVLLSVMVLVIHFLFRYLVRRTESDLDDRILNIVERPAIALFFLFLIITALRALELASWLNELLYKGYLIGMISVVTYVLVKVLEIVVHHYEEVYAKLTETQIDDVLLPIIEKVGKVVIVVVGVVYGLEAIGFNVTMFIAGMGIVGLVVALAAQSTFSNFFGGLHILMDRPFTKGDIVLFEGDWYRVEDVGIRSTRLYDLFKHCQVIMPNTSLAEAKIVNLSGPDRLIKHKVYVGVAYGTDVKKVERILLEIARAHPDILNEAGREPFVRFQEFGDSSLNFMLGFWVTDVDNMYRVASDLHFEINRRFEEEGIEIPFPQRDIHLRTGWERLGQ